MAREPSNLHPGYLVLAAAVSSVLWGMAHGVSDDERGYDVPVVFNGVPDQVVITDQSANVVNIRVLGSRAALRNISPTKLEYPIEVDGARPGPAVFDVDESGIERQLPRGARIISRSPSRVEVKFERRGRKSVRVRADLEGDPAAGFEVTVVEIDPPRVWLVGARSEVLRLSEVVTETIDLTGIEASADREVTLSLGGGHVWMEEQQPVTVKIEVAALPGDDEEEGAVEGEATLTEQPG